MNYLIFLPFPIFAFILAIIFKLRPSWWFISSFIALFTGYFGGFFAGMGGGLERMYVASAICIFLQLILTKILVGRKKTDPTRNKEVSIDIEIPQDIKGENPSAKTPKYKENNVNAKRIFISYRRQDSEDIIGRIYDRLIRDFGEDAVFKDVDSIPLGVDFRDHITKQLDNCGYFLAVIGKDWLEIKDEDGKRRLDDARDHVRIETLVALKKGIQVIPILVRGAKVPSSKKLPEDIEDISFRNGLSVRPDPDFHRDMDRLVEHIKQ